jgi:archaellum component FlaC
MSKDPEDLQTKPTIETVLARINSLGTDINGELGSLKTDVGAIKSDVGSMKSDVNSLRNEFQLFRGEMEIRIDRIEGMTNQTRAEMLNLRADFR